MTRPKLEFSQLFKNWLKELPKEEQAKFKLNGNEVYCQACAKTFVWKQKFQLYQHVATSAHMSRSTSNQDDWPSTGEAFFPSKGISKSFSSGTVSLKWNSQPTILHTALAKMFVSDPNEIGGDGRTEMLTDLCLISADGEMVEAHSIILSLCSPYFQKILMKIQGLRVMMGKIVVILGNVEATPLRNILKFIYTGELDIPSDELDDLVSLGRFLEISELSYLNHQTNAPPSKRKASVKKTHKKSGTGGLGKGITSPMGVGDFDEFQTGVSEDEPDEYSEPEIKIERSMTPFEEEEEDAEFDENDDERENFEEQYEDPMAPSGSGDQGQRPPVGLEPKTKEFILSLFKRGIRKAIFVKRAMEREEMEIPPADQIRTYIKSLMVREWKETEQITDLKTPQQRKGKGVPKVNPKTDVLVGGEEETSSSEDDSDSGTTRKNHDYKRVIINWTETQPLPDDILLQNWNVSKKKEYGIGNNHKVTVNYYCVHGSKRCPAKLKTETFLGKTTFFTNGAEHDNHRLIPHGLSEEQMVFINEFVKKGLRYPSDIKKAMQKDSRIRVAQKSQIRAFLSYERKQVLEKLEALTGHHLVQPILKGPGRSLKEVTAGPLAKKLRTDNLPQNLQPLQPTPPSPQEQLQAVNMVDHNISSAIGQHSSHHYQYTVQSPSTQHSSSMTPGVSNVPVSHFQEGSTSSGGYATYQSYWHK